MRNEVGFLLRIPVIAFLAILWVLSIWPIIVLLNVIGLVLQPIAYSPLYGLAWLHYAILNIEGDILADYWKGYPDDYVNNMKTGFPLLKKWLLDGPKHCIGPEDEGGIFWLAAIVAYVAWFSLPCCGSCCLSLLGTK